MSGKLINVFGEVALDETQRDSRELLEEILIELRIMNVHMEAITNERVRKTDVEERYGE